MKVKEELDNIYILVFRKILTHICRTFPFGQSEYCEGRNKKGERSTLYDWQSELENEILHFYCLSNQVAEHMKQ